MAAMSVTACPRRRRLIGAVALLVVLVAGEAASAALPRYGSVFSFGDSLTDTGNAAILLGGSDGAALFAGAPPYLRGPAGDRASDGRLIVDFIVESLGAPQPTPYLAGETAGDLRRGANFAVGGATALDPAFLAGRGVRRTFVPISLSNQTTWFHNVLHASSSTSNTELKKMMASTLFFFGEMGFNDYTSALINNGSFAVAQSLVPDVVGAVRSALTAVIAAGARTVVLVGMLPIGCEPEMLALFPGGRGRASGCITRLNELAVLHNRVLSRMARALRRAHPAADVRYGGFYRPVMALVTSPRKYGFGDRPLAACCGGGGGPYNFDLAAFCGTPASTTCAEPSKSVSWDGIHYTEEANKFVADAMLRQVVGGGGGGELGVI